LAQTRIHAHFCNDPFRSLRVLDGDRGTFSAVQLSAMMF